MKNKIIHYCWFGGKKKPRIIKKCIRSWKKYAPEYQIIEWNESNFDIDICDYVKEAYKQKKWAFVSDFARYYVLNKYGGVYLDTDVELLKPLDSIGCDKFLGFADDKIVNTGLIMGTEPNDWLCEEQLDDYYNSTFEWTDIKNMYAVGRRTTAILLKHGLIQNGQTQLLMDYTVFHRNYFNPTDGYKEGKIYPESISIHHYAATWFSWKDRLKNNLRHALGKENWEKLKRFFRR